MTAAPIQNAETRNWILQASVPVVNNPFKPDEIKHGYVCNLCLLKPDGTPQTMTTLITKVLLTLFNCDKYHYSSQQFTAAVLKKLPLQLQYKTNNDIINEISEQQPLTVGSKQRQIYIVWQLI